MVGSHLAMALGLVEVRRGRVRNRGPAAAIYVALSGGGTRMTAV